MFDRFTEGARRAVVAARVAAHQLGHSYIGSEHLLLGLIDENHGVGGRALTMLGVSPGHVRRCVAASGLPPCRMAPEQLSFDTNGKRLLAASLREALQLGDTSIDTGHLVLALADQRSSTATRILSEAGVERKAIRNRVLELRVDPSARRAPVRQPVTAAAAGVVSVELSPEAQEMLAWSVRQALRLGLGLASHGPLPLRLLGGAGNAVVRRGARGGSQRPAFRDTGGLAPAACSFCGATSPSCGALLRGATGALICSDCAARAAGGAGDAASGG
jgi:Clp amino terminal domain, pathogenicity island component/ClpX C4-type zinc finger